MSEPIIGFVEEYRWLSNFWPATIYLWGLKFDSSEQAYQYAKVCHDPEGARKILDAKTAGQCKRFARDFKPENGWDDRKSAVMDEVVTAKFEQNRGLMLRLLETGDAHLIEGNTWGDTFWGCVKRDGQWYGQNKLGKILMSIRDRHELLNGAE